MYDTSASQILHRIENVYWNTVNPGFHQPTKVTGLIVTISSHDPINYMDVKNIANSRLGLPPHSGPKTGH